MRLALLSVVPLVVVVVASVGVAAEEEDEVVGGWSRDGRFLHGGFLRDGDSMQWRGGLDLSNLRDTMMQVSSSLDTALDHLTDRIEERVQTSLPLWMRRKHPGGPMKTLPADLEGLEGISGTIGEEGVDDGLKIHFDGDLEGVSAGEGPRYEEPEVEEEVEVEGGGGGQVDGDRAVVVVVDGEDAEETPPFMPFNPFMPFRPFGRPGYNPGFNLFNFGNRRRQWWKGPNVCVDREEIDEGKEAKGDADGDADGVTMAGNTFLFTFGNMEMTSCSETTDKYTCISRNSRRGLHKTVIVTHRCCHGFTREASGCTRVEMHNMADSLQEMGATDFLTLAKATGLVGSLDRNLTLFVPTNEALQDFSAAMDIENELDVDEVFYGDRRRRDASQQDMVMAHMAPGIHYASDLKDEQVLKSVLEGSTLRINTYATSPPTATVNCARLTEVDQHTTHGVVHTINTVLHPVTSTLAQLIKADPQFSILAKLMEQSRLMGELGEEGQFTLFAPTDSAFNALPPSTLEALVENTACLDAVMKNHLLPNVICSAAVQGRARTVNLLDSYLLLERTEEDDELLVGGDEGTRVLARDIVATNGVMHVVDSPILPLEAQPVVEVLENRNLTQFLSLLETAGMLDELAGLTDVTVFAPSNRAIEDLPEDVMERLVSDPVKLRDILNYHVAAPSLQASDIQNNHIARTRTQHPLRINLYSRSPLLAGIGGGRGVKVTAGCSRVSVLDQRACGAVVHIVERLLALPKASVMDHLEDNQKFSIFTQMLKDTGMDETLRGEGPFTVLAPSDHVFRTLPEAELSHLQENLELQRDLAHQHVLQEHVCCAGINPNTWLFMDHKRPLAGSTLHLRRSSFGHLMAGRARITHCSAPSHNGLVHTVSQLLVDVHPNARPAHDTHRRQGLFPPTFSAAHFLNG